MKVRIGDILEATTSVSTTKGEFTLEEGSSDIVEDVLTKDNKQYFWFTDHPGVFTYEGFKILNRPELELELGTIIPEPVLNLWGLASGYNSSEDLGKTWAEAPSGYFNARKDTRKVVEINDLKVPHFHVSGCGSGLVLRLDGFMEFWEELASRGEVKSFEEMNHDTGVTV